MKRLRLLTLLLLFIPSLLHAQGYIQRDSVISSTGRPVPGASIRVCTSSGVGIPCTPTTTIYTDETLGTPKSNPTTADGLGNYSFAVPFGSTYVVTVTGTGLTGYSYRLTTTQPTIFSSLSLTEGTAPSGASGQDVCYGDSTAHRVKCKMNNGSADTPVLFTDKLSVLAATTSAEFAGVISNETGSGLLVFGTSPTLTTPRLAASSTLLDSAGTSSMGLTFKSGSGNGTDYTTTSASYVDVDGGGTELEYAVTVPTGWKAWVVFSGTCVNSTTAASGLVIADVTTVLPGETVAANNATSNVNCVTQTVFAGDGASHTFKPRFKSDGAATVTIQNDTSTLKPVMTVMLTPSN